MYGFFDAISKPCKNLKVLQNQVFWLAIQSSKGNFAFGFGILFFFFNGFLYNISKTIDFYAPSNIINLFFRERHFFYSKTLCATSMKASDETIEIEKLLMKKNCGVLDIISMTIDCYGPYKIIKRFCATSFFATKKFFTTQKKITEASDVSARKFD